MAYDSDNILFLTVRLHDVLRDIRKSDLPDQAVNLSLPDISLDTLRQELPGTTIHINTGVHVDANNRYLDSDGGYSFDITDHIELDNPLQETVNGYIRLTVTID